VRRAVVGGSEGFPILRAQRRQIRRPRDEASEQRQLCVGPRVLLRDELLDVGATAVRIVEAHDLEHAPARGLQRRRPVELARGVEPVPLALQRARVLALVPLRVAQARRLLRETPAGEPVKGVPFEQDLRPRTLLFQEARPGRFHGRYGL
jgi:hypothetical protein